MVRRRRPKRPSLKVEDLTDEQTAYIRENYLNARGVWSSITAKG